MAKLYWRVKKDGKWTWRPAYYHEHGSNHYIVLRYEEDEEE